MGALVNALAIFVAGLLGSKIKTFLPERINQRVMEAVSLSIIVIGISGAIHSEQMIIVILSLVIGTIIGEWLDIDHWIKLLVDKLVQRYSKGTGQAQRIAKGFINASMIFCVGSMVIVGSIESGLKGDNTTLYIKSILDGITAFLLASTLGNGVTLSAIPILIIEGGLTMIASSFASLLTPAMITEIVTVGSILLIGLGLNMLGVKELKIMNFTPAVILPAIFMLFL